jgi:hypothetical protein
MPPEKLHARVPLNDLPVERARKPSTCDLSFVCADDRVPNAQSLRDRKCRYDNENQQNGR